MDLAEKKALVTGGANGIGKSVVEKLINEDVTVGVFDINEPLLKKLKEDHPGLWYKVCDVSDNDQVEESIEEFFQAYGSIDILVNNAGMIDDQLLIGFSEGKLRKYSTETWKKLIDVNLNSVFFMTLHTAEKMLLKRTKGVIVNVSSISANGNPGQTAYAAAKAGIRALTVTWAKELGGFGIRVAGVAPGFTETDLVMQSMDEDIIEDWVKKVPVRRLAKTSEIADGILFIIKNDFFNGRILELDGGLRM